MPDLAAAALAAHRFGFGPRPGELRVIAGDPRNWVKSQLGPDRTLPSQIAALPPAEDDLLAYGRWLVARRLLRLDRELPQPPTGGQPQPGASASDATTQAGAEPAAMAERGGDVNAPPSDANLEQDFIQNFRPRVAAAVAARLEAAMTSQESGA